MANDKILIGTWAWGSGTNGGAFVFGQKADKAKLAEAFETAYGLGFKRWDTAAVYGMGTCEQLLGTLIEGRDDIFISTKFFPSKRYKQGALTESFEGSMARLGRKNADLFWIHVPNNLEKNIEEAVPLIKDGRIRSLGVSNVSPGHVKQAQEILGRHGLALGAVQNHFSLLRNDQQAIIDYCNGNGITYYAYMVLEQGALSGRYDTDHHFPTFSMRNLAFPKTKFKKISGLLSEMKEIASKYDIDQSQIPVLWVLGKGAVPIVGVTKPHHAEQLAKAMNTNLTENEIMRLEDTARQTGIRQQGSWEPQ
ncbi:MAG: aldo/keto reductase [Saccharofermentans sp.]|jgi:aryl-alcohol dehydrogenase-like predicted oxidoreductase|nr:aldo/keto reductase [Saccharofermentans sp.]